MYLFELLNAYRERREYVRDMCVIVRLLKSQLSALEGKKEEFSPDVFDSIEFLLKELIDAYKVVILLTKNNNYQHALVIGRTIFECALDLQYLCKIDTEKRARAFILFPAVGLLKKARRGYKEDQSIEYRILLPHLEANRKEFLTLTNNDRHWFGKTVKEMCDELRLERSYEEWYRRLSEYIHVQYRGHRELNRNSPYVAFLKKGLFKDTIILTLEALKLLNEKYRLLEGGVIIHGYPDKNSITVYSINNNTVYRCVRCGTVPESEVHGTFVDENNVTRSLGFHTKCGGPIVNA